MSPRTRSFLEYSLIGAGPVGFLAAFSEILDRGTAIAVAGAFGLALLLAWIAAVIREPGGEKGEREGRESGSPGRTRPPVRRGRALDSGEWVVSDRKEVLAELERGRQFLETVLDALDHPFYVVDVDDYTVLTANRVAREWGIREGVPCHRATHGADEPCGGRTHPCPLKQMRRERRPLVVQHRHTAPGGGVRHLEVHAYPITDEDGRLVQMIAYTLDVTERIESEEELRASRRLHEQFHTMFQLMADNLPDMLWAKDLKGRYLFVNRALCEDLLGAVDTQEPIGRTDVEFARREREKRPDDPEWHTFGEICIDSDEVVLRTRRPGRFEESGNVRGRRLVLDVHKAPFFDENGRLIGTVGSARDVTVERELEADRRRLQAAIEQAEMGVSITDASGTILYANPAFERITGFPADEVVGKATSVLKEVFPEPECLCEIVRTVTSGRTWRGTLSLRHRGDASRYDLGATVMPVRGSDGEISHFIAYLRDITEKMKMRERNLQAMKLETVGRLAGGIAHDFNNILGAIRAFAEVLELELGSDGGAKEAITEILSATEAGARLTRQLLAFARRQPSKPRPVSLNDLIVNIEKILGGLVGSGITLLTELHPDLPAVLADPAQLEQVLVNLVVNARDAMPGGGRLTIKTDLSGADGMEGRMVALSVSDTGVGMTEDVRARIFEPFFTTKQSGRGSGLGLSTCFGIVNELGGWIQVESEPGAGTTMTVFLPAIADKARDSGDHPALDAVPTGSETILFVEDDPRTMRAVSNQLRLLGYTVLTASDGEEAFRKWEEAEGRIDLLVTDAVMPRLDGPGLIRRLREHGSDVRALLVSGYLPEVSAGGGVLGEGVELLSKPFSLAQIAQTIRQILDADEEGEKEEHDGEGT